MIKFCCSLIFWEMLYLSHQQNCQLEAKRKKLELLGHTFFHKNIIVTNVASIAVYHTKISKLACKNLFLYNTIIEVYFARLSNIKPLTSLMLVDSKAIYKTVFTQQMQFLFIHFILYLRYIWKKSGKLQKWTIQLKMCM